MTDSEVALVAGLALLPALLWWAGTGLVLRNAHSDRAHSPMAVWTAALPFAFYGLWLLQALPAGGAAVVTSYGLVFVVWAWLEVSFYTGFVTGPLKTPCPAGAGVVDRLVHGVKASLYHEIAMIVLGLVIWALSSGAASWAVWFYLMLAGMHTSARLNVLLGVRNLNEHFLPARLAYIGSLFRRRPMNGLMPISLVVSVALTAWLGWAVIPATGGDAAGLVVLTILAALGVVEHLLLVLPLPGHRLFEWALPSQEG